MIYIYISYVKHIFISHTYILYICAYHTYEYHIQIRSCFSCLCVSHILMCDTEWRRCVGCLKLQVTFRKRATNYRALLRKIPYKD